MPFKDLRDFCGHLEAKGDLVRVGRQVDVKYEIAAGIRKTSDIGGPALLFENVRGYDMPVLGGLYATRRRAVTALETTEERVLETFVKGVRSPVAPKIVEDGPCQEIVWMKEQIDLSKLPICYHSPKDAPHPFITAGMEIAKDPVYGRNLSIQRCMVLGKDRIAINAPAPQHLGIFQSRAESRGEPLEVAIAIGVEPVLAIASQIKTPLGVDESSLAGGLRGGAPVELAKCKTIDIEVPSTSEIVIEGKVPPGVRESEGPFGEFTGYYGGLKDKRPTIYLKAVTHRKEPIFQGTTPGTPVTEEQTLRMLGNSAAAWVRIKKAGIPGVRAIYIPEIGCSNFLALISFKRQFYAGNVEQAMHLLWGSDNGSKWVIAVDEDIDIYDLNQVLWALATCVQPHRDILITPNNEVGINLDPSIHPDLREWPSTKSSRIGINATKYFKGYEFPPVIRTGEEERKLIERRWGEYGIA